jgi:hypothetical protein
MNFAVLEILLKPEFTPEQLSHVLGSASTTRVEYTNYGFYVSVEHPNIGKPRRVYSGTLALHGRVLQHDAGFVAFLEDDHLTLETFPWDGETLPATFRDSDVQVVYAA